MLCAEQSKLPLVVPIETRQVEDAKGGEMTNGPCQCKPGLLFSLS